jgi:hypothetical protein
MKTILTLGAAVAIYFALGMLVPYANRTGLVVVILGSWGALTYKLMAAVGSYVLLNRV